MICSQLLLKKERKRLSTERCIVISILGVILSYHNTHGKQILKQRCVHYDDIKECNSRKQGCVWEGERANPRIQCRQVLVPKRLLDLQTHYSQRSDYFSEQVCSFMEERQILSMNAHLLHVKILLHGCPEIYVWAHRETYIKRGIKRKPRDKVRVGAGSRQVLLGSICMESVVIHRTGCFCEVCQDTRSP